MPGRFVGFFVSDAEITNIVRDLFQQWIKRRTDVERTFNGVHLWNASPLIQLHKRSGRRPDVVRRWPNQLIISRCSMMCADHPDVREITNNGVNMAVGIPQNGKRRAVERGCNNFFSRHITASMRSETGNIRVSPAVLASFRAHFDDYRSADRKSYILCGRNPSRDACAPASPSNPFPLDQDSETFRRHRFVGATVQRAPQSSIPEVIAE